MLFLAVGLVGSLFSAWALKREEVRWYNIIVWSSPSLVAMYFLGYIGIPIAALYAAAIWKLDLSRF